MKRTDFLKALVVLPFAPAMLERLKPGVPLGFAHDFMPGEDPALRTGPTGPTDESWVVEFAGATFYLDATGPVMLGEGDGSIVVHPVSSATAPFECRMGVDHLDNGWKRLTVIRGGILARDALFAANVTALPFAVWRYFLTADISSLRDHV